MSFPYPDQTSKSKIGIELPLGLEQKCLAFLYSGWKARRFSACEADHVEKSRNSLSVSLSIITDYERTFHAEINYDFPFKKLKLRYSCFLNKIYSPVLMWVLLFSKSTSSYQNLTLFSDSLETRCCSEFSNLAIVESIGSYLSIFKTHELQCYQILLSSEKRTFY